MGGGTAPAVPFVNYEESALTKMLSGGFVARRVVLHGMHEERVLGRKLTPGLAPGHGRPAVRARVYDTRPCRRLPSQMRWAAMRSASCAAHCGRWVP